MQRIPHLTNITTPLLLNSIALLDRQKYYACHHDAAQRLIAGVDATLVGRADDGNDVDVMEISVVYSSPYNRSNKTDEFGKKYYFYPHHHEVEITPACVDWWLRFTERHCEGELHPQGAVCSARIGSGSGRSCEKSGVGESQHSLGDGRRGGGIHARRGSGRGGRGDADRKGGGSVAARGNCGAKRGNSSSVASASITNAPSSQAAVNSDDPARAQCICLDVTKKHWPRCKYCDKLCSAGITRIKYHLAGIKGFNVTKCKNVPTTVKEEMFALLTKKTGEKEQKNKEKQRDRAEINLDHSDGASVSEEDPDHGNEVLVVKSNPSKGSCISRSAAGGGTIENFYKPPSIEESIQMTQRGIKVINKVQTTLITQKREECRDRACEYICKWFYEASIPHNTVTLPSFVHMLEAIRQFGRGLR
ncbi:hypothetical protein E2562_013678 [Oryza meyeriana var. granulata]|uniref:BED-type domain-containing protein n=1 Tax=Oryza meyeriana var. granulata TaxID=110450 RepID=A0A6G1BLC3_9ORYZ|nr:hypothetical protein E2562_013678 [Oryza meyeriana var. granulata]